MKGKVAKERVIYDNYNLSDIYTDDDLIEIAMENKWVDSEDEITDYMLWDWRNEESQIDWDNAWYELQKFFEGKTVGFFGEIGLWHGIYKAGKIGNFENIFYEAIRDCDCIKIYDENGHLYLTCSHHDGTNCFEIKILTGKGREYLDNWEYDYYENDKRNESYIHNQIYKRYSKIPRYAEKIMGCPTKQYEPITKGKLIDMLNNKARTNY